MLQATHSLCAVLCWCIVGSIAVAQEDAAATEISFYRQVRPILQRRCSGCHSPAKKGGGLVLTSFDDFRKGGEGGESFTPGNPDESSIMDYISGDEPEMPRNDAPLSTRQVQTIATWIRQGAKNDTPASVRDTISAENPPVYSTAPVVTALAYSPDSTLIATSGYREILVHKADGSELVARLIGRSQRIESIVFSPDGKFIGAAGGTPALFGEVQIWDVAERKLVRSVTVSHDTVFGGSFSNDGKLFAFGAADNSVRVINVKDGKQIMRVDTHSDWVLDTTFSLKQDHVISVSRDRSTKLTIVKSGQFVDNVTSITPGALKGGLMAVQRHPKKEQILVGGADGQPRLYKIFRTRKRVIGDDFNHIRSYEKLDGRIFDLQFSGDGKLFIAGASNATSGAAHIYTTGEFDEATINNAGGLGEVRNEIAKRSAVQALKHKLMGIGGPVFAVAWRPDDKQVVVGGFDGTLRFFDVASGTLQNTVVPVSISRSVADNK
ncbi:MAG: c-type cytochrome domain-containing protein [Planctomycetaceae bacterium]